MRTIKFIDKPYKIEQLGRKWFELYKRNKLVGTFSSFDDAKNYYEKELKSITCPN